MSDELRYIVRRFNWRWASPCFIRAPGEIRVAWLDTAANAEAERLHREADARAKVNPFRCGPAFHYLSTFPEPVFRDWLQDADIPLHDVGAFADWAAWWELFAAELSPDQMARVWDGLNRVRFHDVVTRRPSEVGYAVVRVMWHWEDEPWDESYCEAGGGEPLAVFRSRSNAERELHRREALLRPQIDSTSELHLNVKWRDPDQWLTTEIDEIVRLRTDEGPLFEIVEIDLFAAGGEPWPPR